MLSSFKTTARGSMLLFLCTMSTSWASGLEEPEVLSPVISPTQPCKISVVTNENDYERALFHYTFAVGQESTNSPSFSE